MFENLEEEILQKDYLKVIAIINIFVSTLLICIHLVVFVISVHTRTIVKKCFAIFCTFLLLGYFSFLGSVILQGPNSLCTVATIVTRYIFLAQSSWLLVTSTEWWKSISISKAQQQYENAYSRRFVVYSLFGWLEPAAITALALYPELFENAFSATSASRTSETTCRSRQENSFLYYYVMPMNVNLVANLCFLGAAQIKSKQLTTDGESRARYAVDEFRYYLKLNVLVCLMWLIGLVGEYTRSDVLIMVYVIANTLLGLYIFLKITFDNKIWNFIYYEDTCELSSLKRRGTDNGDNILITMPATATDSNF